MNRRPRNVLLTGAAGFIGSRLTRQLLLDHRFAESCITLNDLSVSDDIASDRVRVVQGDFGDASVRARLLENAPDTIFHLAGVLGGAAEADYALARRVNIDSTLALLEEARAPEAPPRIVFASSIAVFGPGLVEPVHDDTPTWPTMSYGAQKRMVEVALEQFSRRGWIDGLAIRLPGIVARPNADARLKSAFLNAVFHAVARGDDFVLPVSPTGTTWLISVPACVEAFLHAALLPGERLGGRRAFTLPAQQVAISDLVAALKARYPGNASMIEYRPDPTLEAQFASQPTLTTACADELGFRHDGDLPTLVARAFA